MQNKNIIYSEQRTVRAFSLARPLAFPEYCPNTHPHEYQSPCKTSTTPHRGCYRHAFAPWTDSCVVQHVTLVGRGVVFMSVMQSNGVAPERTYSSKVCSSWEQWTIKEYNTKLTSKMTTESCLQGRMYIWLNVHLSHGHVIISCSPFHTIWSDNNWQ